MIVLTGPSASGKTATCLYLQAHFGIKKVITHTTRQRRKGEVNNVDYHFVTIDEFRKRKANDEFIETTFYNGNYYGTSRKEVQIDKCRAVEGAGAKTYKSFHDPKIVLFYRLLDEQTRRERRESRGDDPEKIKSRLLNDEKSFRLDDERKQIVDVYVDTKKYDIPSVSEFIYNKYLEVLKKNGVDISTLVKL